MWSWKAGPLGICFSGTLAEPGTGCQVCGGWGQPRCPEGCWLRLLLTRWTPRLAQLPTGSCTSTLEHSMLMPSPCGPPARCDLALPRALPSGERHWHPPPPAPQLRSQRHTRPWNLLLAEGSKEASEQPPAVRLWAAPPHAAAADQALPAHSSLPQGCIPVLVSAEPVFPPGAAKLLKEGRDLPAPLMSTCAWNRRASVHPPPACCPQTPGFLAGRGGVGVCTSTSLNTTRPQQEEARLESRTSSPKSGSFPSP